MMCEDKILVFSVGVLGFVEGLGGLDRNGLDWIGFGLDWIGKGNSLVPGRKFGYSASKWWYICGTISRLIFPSVHVDIFKVQYYQYTI